MFPMNNYTHDWHAEARKSTMMEVSHSHHPRLSLVPYRQGSALVWEGEEGSVGVKVVNLDGSK